MCGIAGFQGKHQPELIVAMAKKIAHRGPDNIGYFIDPVSKITLAHTRLSILDLSALSNQPLWDVSHRFCIVFNGEIYNYKEIRAKLEKRGCIFKSNGDAEVLLMAYACFDVDLFGYLSGIYAFAIWDSEKKELLIARDELGVKPLYYSENGKYFIFSSEIKSLLCDVEISRELDFNAIGLYSKYLWCPSPLTPLRQVKKLEPGCWIKVRDGKIISHQKFFRLTDCDGQQKIETVREAIHELTKALQTSVENQLVSDVPIGAFLSGGLDSTSVVSVAAQKLGANNLPCFTIEFPSGSQDGDASDLPYAKLAAKHIGVPLHVVSVSSDIFNDFPNLIYQLDEPQADLAPLNAWYIAKLAKSMGIKVLLSGAGGDDILTGYRRHFALQQERYWRWLPDAVLMTLRRSTQLFSKGNPFLRKIAKAFEYADMHDPQRIGSYFWWLNPSLVSLLLTRKDDEPVDPLLQYLMSSNNNSSSRLRTMLALDTNFFLPDHNFNYTDKTSMACGVEVRVPLADRNILNVASRMPDNYLQNGIHGKWIFKKAMEARLPADLIYRKKTGFNAPVRSWLRGDMRNMVDEVLSKSVIEQRGIYHWGRVKELVENDRTGKIDAAYTLLSLISVELWCRQFVDPVVPTPISF